MKLDDGSHDGESLRGPKTKWFEWRARRDKAIARPRRGQAAAKLEKLKRKAKS